jgi:hypothetical protein
LLICKEFVMANLTLPLEGTATNLIPDGTAFEVACQSGYAVVGKAASGLSAGVFGQLGGAWQPGGLGGVATLTGGVVGTTNVQFEAGVRGVSQNGPGVQGESSTSRGVVGSCNSDAGVFGSSSQFDGVHGESQSNQHAGVSGINNSGGQAGGLILDRQKFSVGRVPLTLVGKVYSKVDAAYGCIEIGDLLTTSPTPGHAMKAIDPVRSFGAIIGKALKPLRSGKQLVPILVALQ